MNAKHRNAQLMWSIYSYGALIAVMLTGTVLCATSVPNVWMVLLPALTLLLLAGVAVMRIWQREIQSAPIPDDRADRIQESFLDQYDSLTASSNDIILLVAEDGSIVKANDRAAAAYGYTRDELKRLNIRAVRSQKTHGDIVQQTEMIKGKGGLVFETEHRRRGGEVFPVETSSRLLEIDGKQYFHSIIRDTTDRKRAEHRLTRLNDCLLGFGVDSVKNINSLVALCGELMGASTALYNRIELGCICSVGQWNTPDGYQGTDKAEGHLCTDLIHGGMDSLMVVRDLQRTSYFKSDPNVSKYGLKTYVGKGVRFGHESIGSLCAVFTEDLVPSSDDEHFMNIIAAAIGVEERRKHNEESLRESEERYRRLVDLSPEAIAVHAEGRFVFVNESGLRLIGAKDMSELVGKSILDIVHPDYKGLVKERARSQGEQAVRQPFVEEKFVRFDGSAVDVEVTTIPISYGGKPATLVVARGLEDRKRTEEDVRRSETRFRRVWESSMDGMRILDASGKIVMVNDAFCRLMGKPETAVVGKPYTVIYESISSEQDEADLQTYQERFATGTFQRHQEGELPLEGGNRILVEISNSLLEMPNEAPLLLSIFRDVTERREAERKLRESEEKFRSVAEQSPNMIYINMRGKVVYVNQRCVDMMGFTKEEFYAPEFNFMSLISPEYGSVVQENFKKHASGGEIPTYEYVLLSKDGRRIVGLHTTRLINLEGESAILGIVTDVTEHRHVEEELRKLHRAVEQSPTSVVITDRQGAIEYVNPKFSEVTGYTFDEVKGQTPRVVKSGYTSAEEYTKLWETILSGKEWRGEFLNKKKNGEQFWELASISPVRDIAGTITHFLAVKEDITQRKMLEQQLFQARKMESLGTLASGIAHDFNNILGIILGYATMLRGKSVGKERASLYLEAVVKAADRGAGLVRQILTFARKSEFRLELVDLNSIIGELTTMLGETFPRTISLSLQLEKALPPVSVDRTQIHQALLNLCVNARDAMADHGSITIATRLVHGKSLAAHFVTAEDENYVEISVSDTGSGIDEKTKARIFEPFFTTKEIGKGTGLGLSVVFGVVEAHKGLVSVDSELGRGSTFHVYLPLPPGSVPSESQEVAESDEELGGFETILVVEDEPLMLGFVTTLLEQKGYRVLIARDGEEAVKFYEREKGSIQLVLSDFGLPKLDGWEACLRMKNMNPGIRIVLASGYLDPHLKAEILKAGIGGFVGKPYSPKEILKAIRTALES